MLMYRAMIGLEKYSTVKAEISEDASSDLQAVKRLARYIHKKADRAECVSVGCTHTPRAHTRTQSLSTLLCTLAIALPPLLFTLATARPHTQKNPTNANVKNDDMRICGCIPVSVRSTCSYVCLYR